LLVVVVVLLAFFLNSQLSYCTFVCLVVTGGKCVIWLRVLWQQKL